jgi:hypothetical protein
MDLPPVSDEGQRLSAEHCPRVLPAGWELFEPRGAPAGMFHNRTRKLGAMFSVERERDGKRWIHISVSHRDRIPTWDELRHVKDWMIGKDKLAIQVLPPEAQYVNEHPRTLHLWHCLDGDPTPDFRHHDMI